MKTLFLTLTLLLSASLFGQSVPRGQVSEVIWLPNGSQTGFTHDFSITQNVGGNATNYFSYSDKDSLFTLKFTGHYGCEKGCEFEGSFTQWYTPTTYPNGCMAYAADLSGYFRHSQKEFYDVPAFYTQLFCYDKGAWRYAGGDFTVKSH